MPFLKCEQYCSLSNRAASVGKWLKSTLTYKRWCGRSQASCVSLQGRWSLWRLPPILDKAQTSHHDPGVDICLQGAAPGLVDFKRCGVRVDAICMN